MPSTGPKSPKKRHPMPATRARSRPGTSPRRRASWNVTGGAIDPAEIRRWYDQYCAILAIKASGRSMNQTEMLQLLNVPDVSTLRKRYPPVSSDRFVSAWLESNHTEDVELLFMSHFLNIFHTAISNFTHEVKNVNPNANLFEFVRFEIPTDKEKATYFEGLEQSDNYQKRFNDESRMAIRARIVELRRQPQRPPPPQRPASPQRPAQRPAQRPPQRPAQRPASPQRPPQRPASPQRPKSPGPPPPDVVYHPSQLQKGNAYVVVFNNGPSRRGVFEEWDQKRDSCFFKEESNRERLFIACLDVVSHFRRESAFPPHSHPRPAFTHQQPRPDSAYPQHSPPRPAFTHRPPRPELPESIHDPTQLQKGRAYKVVFNNGPSRIGVFEEWDQNRDSCFFQEASDRDRMFMACLDVVSHFEPL